MTTMILANDVEKTIEYVHWETLATQYGMDSTALPEYWDDEIDTIRSFDLLTQRRDENLKKIFISPAREVLFGDAAQTASALREFLSQRKGAKKEKLAEASKPILA